MNEPITKPNQSCAYLLDGRLEDILALIQILGIGVGLQRTEQKIRDELLAKPQSADSWITVADTHREFFRVYKSSGNDGPLASLLTRRLLPVADRKLSREFVLGFMNAAIRIHATQLQRRQILKAAWLGGILIALSTLASIIAAVATILKP